MKCRIKEIRKAAGLKQSELAKLSGIAQENISRYEQGRLNIENMTLAAANSVAKACNCRIEDIFEEEKTMEKEVYILRKYSTAIKDKNFEYKEGCAVDYELERGSTNICIEEIFRTEDKDAALKELSKYHSFAKKNSFRENEWFVSEYWVDIERWDIDDEPVFIDLVGTEAFAQVDVKY